MPISNEMIPDRMNRAAGHWAVACQETNRRQLTGTLPEAEALRKFWKGRYPDCRVTIRPLTEAAMMELYRLNGWPRPVAPVASRLTVPQQREER